MKVYLVSRVYRFSSHSTLLHVIATKDGAEELVQQLNDADPDNRDKHPDTGTSVFYHIAVEWPVEVR
jgi:hypothetical protein